MNDLQRIKKVINWLIYTEHAENEAELATKLGYNKSSFSQLVNGKVTLSDKFIKKLCGVDENINFVWVKNGSESMFNPSFTLNDGLPEYNKAKSDIKKGEIETRPDNDKNYRLVPLYSTDIIVSNVDQDIDVNVDENGNIIGYMPFVDAKQNDICLPVSTDSMLPVLAASTIILVRKIDCWREYLEFGQIYIIQLNDDRRIINVIKKGSDSNHYLLHSPNDDYDDTEISKDFIKSVRLVISKYRKVVQ